MPDINIEVHFDYHRTVCHLYLSLLELMSLDCFIKVALCSELIQTHTAAHYGPRAAFAHKAATYLSFTLCVFVCVCLACNGTLHK